MDNKINLFKKYNGGCPYCGSPVIIKDSIVIYHNVSHGLVYICSSFPKCKAYVYVNTRKMQPLGILGDKTLRMLKRKAHLYFDIIWELNILDRTRAYKWLARKLKITNEDCHIGYFDQEMTRKVIDICKPIYNFLLIKVWRCKDEIL